MDKIVSVIIPSFNRKRLTDTAVESVVTSSPGLVEIIVVDDCSTTAYSFGAANSCGVPVRVVRLDENIGPGMARKKGIEQASARLIAFLDSDDTYDMAWMDYVINVLREEPELCGRRIMISGITLGERRVGAFVRRALGAMPRSLQLIASRIVATMFNPFYIQSVVLGRDLCFFIDGLRHCEDYYTIAFALFGAERIVLPDVVACRLGREANSSGGESSDKAKMHRGEMLVRRELLREARVPAGYKLLVPLGMAYQRCRSAVKRLFGWEA